MEKYCFDNFVIGKANQLAYLSVKRTIKKLGEEINPLFIHASSGLGKTHLMNAVTDVLRNSEIQWLNGVEIENIPPKSGSVLIFEDIHLLKEEVRKGMELFELVKSYIQVKEQVYLTSLGTPLRSGLSQKLMSMIKQGLVVPIFKPDSELIKRLFQTKSQEFEIELSEDVLKYLASLPFSDMNGIETAVKKIGLLKEIISEITIDNIKDTIDVEDIIGEGKGVEEGEETEYSDFVQGLRQGLGEIVSKRRDQRTAKEEYTQKLYIWRMKGFNVTRLEKAMQGPLDGIIQAFVSFTSDVQRLIELQKQYGEMERYVTKEECEYFEKELFNPDAVIELSNALAKIEDRKKIKVEHSKFLDSRQSSKNFIILPSNRKAYKVLIQVVKNSDKLKFPVYIHGNSGCGKTHLLMAFAKKIQFESPFELVSYIPSEFLGFSIKNLFEEKAIESYVAKLKSIDTLFLDNIQELVKDKDGRCVFLKILNLFKQKGKRFIVSSTFSPQELDLEDEDKKVFIEGTVIHIKNIEKTDREIILTNLFIEKDVSLNEDLKEFLANQLSGNFINIRKNVEKITRKIIADDVEMTVEDVAECVGIKTSTVQVPATEDFEIKEEIQVKSSKIDFDLRWPYLNERIFEEFDV